MGIMPGGKEGGKERSRRGRSKAPPAALAAPLSLCEKALRISLACAHTRERGEGGGRAARVCAISSMQCGLPGFSDGLSFPLSPLLHSGPDKCLDSISPAL